MYDEETREKRDEQALAVLLYAVVHARNTWSCWYAADDEVSGGSLLTDEAVEAIFQDALKGDH